MARITVFGALGLLALGGCTTENGMQNGFARLDDWRVAYQARGEGDRAVVFVHGWSGNAGHWHRQMAGLETGRRLVALDLPGHGDSDKPVTGYSMDLFARAVVAVLDDLGIGGAVVVGHSNGVPVARQLHRRWPERVEAMVFVDGPLEPIPAPTLQWMKAAMDRPDYEQFMAGMVAQTPTGDLLPEDVERIRTDALAMPRHVQKGGLEAMSDPEIWTEDPIDVPLLVLKVADPRPGATADYEQRVRRFAPHADYQVWDDATHFLILERPDRFNRLLEDFLARLD